ncbi:MAG TPA: MG2 domain-containing protein, partial [Anaerolineae bacterium]|nr:MG2 domain-containing protein [Anaerolineae bacterium]
MLQPDRYSFIPPLHKRHLPIVVAWIVVVVIIALISSRGAAASSIGLSSPLQSPLPTPSPTPQPLIVSFSPGPGQRDVDRHTPLIITFRLDLDHRIMLQGLTIDPPISGTIKWQGRTLVFTPDRGWQPDRTYRITVKYRDQVLAPSWTFSTSPLITLISPSQTGSANWNDPIQISFSEAMDHASVEAAFSTNPESRGQFYWQDNTLTFKPLTDWAEGTHYVITFETSLKTAKGEQPLEVPRYFYFTTVDESGEVSFGYGPKFQVVDPAGRRAVQFLAWGNLVRPATVRLYSIGLEQFLDRYTSGFRSVGPSEDKPIKVDDLKLLRTWQVPVHPAEFTLPSDLTPGLYVLTLDHPVSKIDELIILYTHHTLVLKQADGYIATWASQIDGGPLADMHIRVFSRDAKLIAEGQTDAQGLFVTQVPIDPQPLIVVGERDGDVTASGLSNEWMQGGWYGWWEPRPKAQTTRSYIYTDRPIYRPGQTVHVKVITRYDNDAIYSRIPLEWDVIVRLRDARDNVIATKTLHVNEYGTLDTSFDLAEGGTLGEYHIETQIKDDVQRQAFKVEEYRKPEFEVTLQTDRTNIVNGDRISLTVEAKTYFGAPLPQAHLVLNQLTRTYAYYWYDADSQDTWNTLQAEEPLGVTDADGRWSGWIDLKVPDYFFQEYYYNQHTIPVLLEVMVNDNNGQGVAAQARVTVHDATLNLSGGLDRYMYKPGETITANAMTRDINGKPRANEPVTVKILKWSGQKYDQVMAQASAVSDQSGAVELTLAAPDQGWYRAEITGRAPDGAEVAVIDWLWVYDSKNDVSWYYDNSSGMQINTDKDRYVSGETAQLLIRSPISGPALLSVERGRVRRAQVVQLTSPTTLVPLLIQDDDAPNIYVTINAYQPVEKPREEAYMSIPDARLLVASTKLSVSADQRKLTVLVTPVRSSYGPREQATFTIQVTGADGRPAQAELSLALVDEAIYALSNELVQDPFTAFYGERSNDVRTFDSLKPTRYIGGGMGGGGGDGGLLGNPRFNFPDTAYWNARIVTDEQGRAVVKVTLPDSLTRWRAVVRAVTADEFPRVGEAVAKITTTQPIVIRPVLPRQLVQGDRVLISAIVHNNTDRDRTAVVWADFNSAVSLRGGRQADEAISETMKEIASQKALAMTYTLTISANSSTVVGWPIEVQTLDTLTVTMRVKSDKAADAVRLSVPIGPLAVPEVAAIIGNTTSSAEHTIDLPANTIKEISTLQIDLSPSIAASILDGLAYLTGYPYGCVEQTMSKALPNAVVGRAFTALGVDNPQIKADLPSKVNAGLQRLYGYQHNDGGWGWWFDDSTDDYQTAYVLFGLAMTKQAG